jgi:hypothetical protein
MYRAGQAYTVGIRFPSTTKMYHFATMTRLSVGDLTEVRNIFGDDVKVRVESVKVGILPKVKKWRTGGVVTEQQHNQFGIKEEDKMSKKLIAANVIDALRVLRKLQRDLEEKSSGSPNNYSISLSKTGSLITCGISQNTLPQCITLKGDVQKLVDFIYEDDAKTQARERLAALEKEAAEIRKLLS